MGDGGFQWKLLLFIALAITLSFSTVLPCPQCYRTDVFLSSYIIGNDTYVNATLIASTQEYHAKVDQEKLLEQYEKTVRGDPTAGEGEIGEFETGGDVFPLAGENIHFFYYGYETNPETEQVARRPIEVPGCAPLETGAAGSVTCKLPKSVYENKCVQVFSEYRGSAVYFPSSTNTIVCDEKASLFGSFGSVLAAYLDPSNSVCLMSMVIMGLLLASMFFTGRSPLMLLDITTPLLPKAKSVHYGSIMYTRGYMRLARSLQDNAKNLGKGLDASTKALLNKLSGEEKKKALEILANNKNASPAMLYLAVRNIEKGRYKDAKKLVKIKPDVDTDENLEFLSKSIKKLADERGGTPDVDLQSAAKHAATEQQLKLLGVATGGLPKWVGKVNKVIRDNVPWVGPQLSVATGSMVVGMKQVGRAYQGMAMGAIHGADVLAKGKVISGLEQAEKSRPATLGRKITRGMAVGMLGFYKKQLQTFRLLNIEPREEQLYKELHGEAKVNVLMYLLKRYMKEKGVDLDLSSEEFINIYEIKVLQKMKLKAALGQDGDAFLRELLSEKGTIDDKIRALSGHLRSQGIFFDEARISGVLAKLNAIESMQVAGSEKYYALMEYLREAHKTDISNLDFRGAAGVTPEKDRFYFWLGRNELKFEGQTGSYDDTWSFLFLRNLVEQADKGNLAEGRASVFDIAKFTWLQVTNELFGLIPSSTKGLDADISLAMKRAENYLATLLTGKGRESYDKLLEGMGADADLFQMLYSGRVSGTPEAGGSVSREFGPDPENWKLDMKGYWLLMGTQTSAGPLARVSVANEAKDMSEGGSFQKDPGQRPAEFRFAKGDSVMSAYTYDFLYSRLKDKVGGKHPNAYYHTNDEDRFLKNVRDAYRQRYCEMNNIERSYMETLYGADGANAYIDMKMRNEKFMENPIDFRALGSHTWIKVREGAYVPYFAGMRVSDAEGIVNGRLSVKINGQWSEFHPEEVSWRVMLSKLVDKDNEAKNLAHRAHLLFNQQPDETGYEGEARNRFTNEVWRKRMEALADGAAAWGKRTGNEKAAASMVYEICSSLRWDTNAMDRSGLLDIRQRSETTSGKSLLGRYSLAFARGWEAAMMSTFLPQTKVMFDLAANSEYYRDNINRLSASIARGDFYADNPDLAKTYTEVNRSIRRYHEVWDDTITRDPRGNTTAIGSQFIFASYFHHGPAVHFDPYWNADALKHRKGEFWERIRTAPLAVNWLVGAPFVLMYRGMQTAQYGYPTRQDKSFNPMNNWMIGRQRTLEGMRSFFSPFYTGIDFSADTYRRSAAQVSTWAFSPLMGLPVVANRIKDALPRSINKEGWPMKWLDKSVGWIGEHESYARVEDYDEAAYRPYYIEQQRISEKLLGPLIKKNFGGRELRNGLRRTHEDSEYIYKNTNVVWGNANPGASYLDFEHSMRIDPKLAIHLSTASKYSSYFAQDDYIRKQANTGTIKRPVHIMQLAAEREMEQRHYGETVGGALLHNPLAAWINPALFMYYGGGVPVLANMSLNNLYQHKYKHWREQYAEKKMEYVNLDKTEQKNYIRGMLASTVYSIPGKVGGAVAEKVGLGEYPSIYSTKTKYCPHCRSPMAAGSTCPSCKKRTICPHCHQQVQTNLYHSCTKRGNKPTRLKYNPKTGNYEAAGFGW